MRKSPLPPLFTFLRALAVLQVGRSGSQQEGVRPGSALKELLGDYFPTQISKGAGALAGLDSAPASFTGAAFASDTEALAALIDQVTEARSGKNDRGDLDGFSPDAIWLAPAQRTSRGFQWDLRRDLLTRQMVEELPKGHPEKARWKRSRTAFDVGNPVEIRSRIWSTVANESSAAAYQAWFTMKGGFHPCLKGRLELIRGPIPSLELKISCASRDHAAFGLLRRRVSGRGLRANRFKLLLGDGNVPKRVCLSLTGIPDREMICAGWNVFRAWIDAVQLPPEKMDTAANRHTWREHPKVRRFGITDPYLAFCVAKYENRIDWRNGQITSQKTLAKVVKGNLLPALRKAIKDSCDPAHCQDRLDDPGRYIERGGAISVAAADLAFAYEVSAPAHRLEQAEQKLLRCLLAEKVSQTNRWVSYLSRENPLYRENPAFQWMVLDFVLKSSPAGTLNPPVRLNHEALALLHGGIVAGAVRPTDNLLRTYESLRDSADTGDHLPEPARWLVFKGENWVEEAEILAAESQGSGWCVGQEDFANSYLQDTTFFHVLKISGRARVALRFANHAIVETQGPNNEDPGEYWPRALFYSAVRRLPFYLHREDSDPRGNEAQAAAEQGKTQVRGLDAVALAARLQASPYDVQFASAQQIADPPNHEAISAAWHMIIDEYPAAAAIAPAGFGRDERLREQWMRKVAQQKTVPLAFQWEV